MATVQPHVAAAVARPVLVLGMGATGASCARHFAARGTPAWFADTRAAPPGLEAIRRAMPAAGLLPGAMPDTVPPGVESIVVSPGVDLGLPVLGGVSSASAPKRQAASVVVFAGGFAMLLLTFGVVLVGGPALVARVPALVAKFVT